MTEQTTQVSAPAPAPIESRTRDHVMGEIVHNLTLAMQAAWIEWQHGGGADQAMQWIENTLWGPGLIPDKDEPHGTQAQEYFDAHTDAAERVDRLTAENPDDAAIDRFAIELKKKLAKAREKGRGGWQTCHPTDLSRMLREHVDKGDPRDVANFCAFLWALGHPISPAALCFELTLVPPDGAAAPAPCAPPDAPTLFRWKTSWGDWTYRTERPAGWKDLRCFEAYSLSAPEQGSASPAALTVATIGEQRRCQQCKAPRKGDICHKCGSPTVEPCAGWEEPALPPIDRIRELAREVGYAIGVHGTQERDLDLIAAPWTEDAATLNYREVMQHIADGLGARLVEVEGKPLGRRACTIQMDGWYKPIDLSVCPMLAASPADQVEDARNLLTAASHALRSYQYGNGAPDLAESIADRIDAAMSASKEGA